MSERVDVCLEDEEGTAALDRLASKLEEPCQSGRCSRCGSDGDCEYRQAATVIRTLDGFTELRHAIGHEQAMRASYKAERDRLQAEVARLQAQRCPACGHDAAYHCTRCGKTWYGTP
jgi:ribosomal protein S27AE